MAALSYQAAGGQTKAPEAQPQQAQTAEFKGRGIEVYKTMFRNAEQACLKERELVHRDRDWHDNFDDSQWTAKEKEILRKRGQPIVTSNRIKRKVGFLCGLEQRQRTDPKAFPRTKKNEDGAKLATQVLDFVEQETRFDRTASASFKDLAIGGIEAAEVIVDSERNIEVNLIQYDSFFRDPRSKKNDFSDARYLGYQDWFDEDDALEMFPSEQQKLAITGALDTCDSYDEGYEDKPYGQWLDKDSRRVRIACMYWRGNGTWNYTYFTTAGVLDEGVSKYHDDKGKPACAIEAARVYTTRNNETYGVVRDMISPQSEMNFRRSMMLALLKNRRTWARAKGILPEGAGETLARPDGSLIANGKYGEDWGFVESQSEIAGQFELLQESKQEIDVQGPNAGLQGRGVENQSGVAIERQQVAGATEENDIFDAHNDWKLRIYRAMWARAKQFWTEERYIRITDENEQPGFVAVNQPVPAMDPTTGQPMVHPETGQPMAQAGPNGQPMMHNALADVDVDIILEAVPDVITLQAKEFDDLVKLAGGGVPIPPDVLVEASQIDGKQKLVQRMKEEMGSQAKLQQAAQQIEQMGQVIEQMKKQLEQAGGADKQLEMAKLQMEAQKEQGNAQLKAAELDIKKAELALKGEEINLKRGELALKGKESELKEADLALRQTELVTTTQLQRDQMDMSERQAAAQAMQAKQAPQTTAERPDRTSDALGKGLEALAAAMTKPKSIVRGPDGRAIGVE